MDPRHRLTRAIVLLILVAALVSAPAFLFAEGFEARSLGRVVASNGVCVVMCAGLLFALRAGRTALAARVLVFALAALVGWLAWVNGEDVHVNVINFVLVAVLAAVLLGRAALVGVGVASALEMIGIAWKQAQPRAGEDLAEARFESIAQFLPSFAVVVAILWLQAGAVRGDDARAPRENR